MLMYVIATYYRSQFFIITPEFHRFIVKIWVIAQVQFNFFMVAPKIILNEILHGDRTPATTIDDTDDLLLHGYPCQIIGHFLNRQVVPYLITSAHIEERYSFLQRFVQLRK